MHTQSRRPYSIAPHLAGPRPEHNQEHRHPKQKKLLLSLLVVLLSIGSLYSVYALTRPLPQLKPHVISSPQPQPQSPSLAWPGTGESAVGAVGYGLLAEHGSQVPTPTASTIKVLTALAVLKQKPLISGSQGPTLTLTDADVALYDQQVNEDGSVVHVEAGEQITEYQALQALLLPSANNMAYTLATWAYGSVDAYLAAANQLAASLGMSSTTVTDPSGLTPTTVSTAGDMVKLGVAAMKEPAITEIVSQKTANIPVEGEIENVDTLLGTDDIVGIKTGNTDEAGGCFLGARQEVVGGKTITVITAILNASDLDSALRNTPALSAATAQNFNAQPVAKKGTLIATYTAPWLATAIAANTAGDVAVVHWSDEKQLVNTSLQNLKVGAAKATHAGTITVSNAHGQATTVPVILGASVRKPSLSWRLTHPF